MRKVVFTLLVVITFTLGANGQIEFGVKAGLNMSNQIGDNTDDNVPKSGFHVGLTSDINVGPIGIQPSILFVQKGFNASGDLYETSCRLNYLEIPVNFYYGIGFGNNKVQFIVGPYYGAVLGGKCITDFDILGEMELEIVKTDNATINSLDDLSKYYIKQSEIGLNVGLGARIGPIQAQVLYGFGLTNIVPKTNGEESDEVNKSSNIQLSVAYFF